VGWGWELLFFSFFSYITIGYQYQFYLKRKKSREIIDSVINVTTSTINLLDFKIRIIIITAGYVCVRVDFQIPN
jgi:hypothetical protein